MPDAVSESDSGLNRAELDSLVEAVARQDRDAFARLFNFYAPRVKAYLIRLNASNGLAEELAQEVMLTVWRKAHLFDRQQAGASTWIFRIARNRRIDAARRAAKPELDEHDPALQPTPLPAPDHSTQVRQRQIEVRKAMIALPEEQITLLEMAYFDGLSHREISDKLNLPLGTVKSRIRLAFEKLRNLLHADSI